MTADSVTLDISGIAEAFPRYRVALLVAHDLRVSAERPEGLDGVIATVESEAARLLAAQGLAELPELRAWREAYKAFGVKKTSYRSSVERLLKGIQQGRGLPRINSLVDAYNAVSVHHRMPVGADDLAKLSGGLAFRLARPDDSFIALGDAEAKDDPPKPGEVVYADAGKLLCRRWNWYQDARSATSLETGSAALTVQSLDADPEPAAAHLADWLAEYCGATCAWAHADAATPVASVAF